MPASGTLKPCVQMPMASSQESERKLESFQSALGAGKRIPTEIRISTSNVERSQRLYTGGSMPATTETNSRLRVLVHSDFGPAYSLAYIYTYDITKPQIDYGPRCETVRVKPASYTLQLQRMREPQVRLP